MQSAGVQGAGAQCSSADGSQPGLGGDAFPYYLFSFLFFIFYCQAVYSVASVSGVKHNVSVIHVHTDIPFHICFHYRPLTRN